MRLMHAYWQSGPAKDDDRVLARLVGLSSDEWANVRPDVVRRFSRSCMGNGCIGGSMKNSKPPMTPSTGMQHGQKQQPLHARRNATMNVTLCVTMNVTLRIYAINVTLYVTSTQ